MYLIYPAMRKPKDKYAAGSSVLGGVQYITLHTWRTPHIP